MCTRIVLAILSSHHRCDSGTVRGFCAIFWTTAVSEVVIHTILMICMAPTAECALPLVYWISICSRLCMTCPVASSTAFTPILVPPRVQKTILKRECCRRQFSLSRT